MKYIYFSLFLFLVACADDYDPIISNGSRLEIYFDDDEFVVDVDPCNPQSLNGSDRSRDSIHSYRLSRFENRSMCIKIGFRIVDHQDDHPYSRREIASYFDDFTDPLWLTVFPEFSIDTDGELFSNIWTTGEGRTPFRRSTNFQSTDDFSMTFTPPVRVIDDFECLSGENVLVFTGTAQGYLYNEDYSRFIEVEFAEFDIELPF